MAAPTRQILVVEDDPGIAESLGLALGELGLAVMFSPSGRRGWADLVAMPAPPALILLDVLLSGEDGLDLCLAIKAHLDYRAIPVIVMSAHPAARRRAQAAGADDFLAKPFDLDQLETLLTRHLPVVP